MSVAPCPTSRVMASTAAATALPWPSAPSSGGILGRSPRSGLHHGMIVASLDAGRAPARGNRRRQPRPAPSGRGQW